MNRAAAALVATLAVVAHAPPPAAAINPGLDDQIRISDVTYVAQESATSARWPDPVPHTLLGEEHARVTCLLRGRRACPDDAVGASVLPIGTAIHRVNGYRPAFRLAARRDCEIVLYEAWENRRATRGGDLYDLAGNVVAIEIIREDRSTTSALRKSFSNPDGARVEDPRAVEKLVDLILAAPTVPRDDRRASNPRLRYWLTFHFRDGTATGRAYDPESGQLARSLTLPAEFRAIVEDAVNFAEPKPR